MCIKTILFIKLFYLKLFQINGRSKCEKPQTKPSWKIFDDS